MLKRNAWAGFVLLTLMLLEGSVALAHANAQWSLSFNDPARFDIGDVSGVIVKTITYRDSMEDARQALLLVPRPLYETFEAPETAMEVPQGAKRPRAPPVA